MKIALYGGSFNPPHVCHVLAATWVLSTRPVDVVWFVPTYIHAFGKELIDFDLRCEMVSRAAEPLGNRAVVSRVEEELSGVSRTIDTVEYLFEQYPDDEFSLLIGADILLEAHKWKKFDELLEMVDFHVLGRAGVEVEGRRFDIELPEVSSTELRQHLADGELDYCVERLPIRVLDFIVERGLFLVPS